MHTYSLHGLKIESQLCFPELEAYSGSGLEESDPIVIGEGTVDSLANGKRSKEGFLITENQALLHLGDAASIMVSGGRSIVFQTDGEIDMGALRLFLLSAAVGCALHQRGMFPLHAAALEHDGHLVAFCGNAGDGKSTLVTGFAMRGGRAYSDDRIVLYETSGGAYRIWPGVPIFHLQSDSAQQSGLGSHGLAGDSWRFGKFVHFAKQFYSGSAMPLERIYFLDWVDTDQALSIRRMESTEALMRLRRDVSVESIVPLMNREAAFLSWARKVVKSIPAFLLRRPRNYLHFEKGLDAIKRHIVSEN